MKIINRISDKIDATFNDTTVIRGKNKETGEDIVIRVTPRLKLDDDTEK
jgi:hypothetical protein